MQLKDILFPKACLNCGSFGSYICLKCQKQLIFVKKDTCLYCGRSSLFGLTHPGCIRQEGVDGFISIYYYNSTLKRIIKNIKYRLVRDAIDELVKVIDLDILAEKLKFFKVIKQDPYINPIPLYKERFKKRGFNQADSIAGFFTTFLKLPMSQSLIKIKNTNPQASLRRGQDRYLNMLKAFEVKKDENIQGKSLILIDDLVTTGSTVKSAAKVLKRNRAKKVYILALAKG